MALFKTAPSKPKAPTPSPEALASAKEALGPHIGPLHTIMEQCRRRADAVAFVGHVQEGAYTLEGVAALHEEAFERGLTNKPGPSIKQMWLAGTLPNHAIGVVLDELCQYWTAPRPTTSFEDRFGLIEVRRPFFLGKPHPVPVSNLPLGDLIQKTRLPRTWHAEHRPDFHWQLKWVMATHFGATLDRFATDLVEGVETQAPDEWSTRAKNIIQQRSVLEDIVRDASYPQDDMDLRMSWGGLQREALLMY